MQQPFDQCTAFDMLMRPSDHVEAAVSTDVSERGSCSTNATCVTDASTVNDSC